ncbi:hypothetical protein ACFOOM_31530 [Streptomyces echinoruber]|uniref:Uncharacterized protein n=1 Tax=Streptomyces echinoruber TaxID=68898 RepID=A0A918VKW6_9ACTN|nr:hypothetical protein [Streptomyces echinoruber]GHA09806.1 hypothetical protein GCM10010389_56230 [Streptomyces echinoruber]
MIASTPVAGWTWGRDDERKDALASGLRDALIALESLGRHRLAVGEVRMRVSVTEAGRPESRLFDGEFPLSVDQGLVSVVAEELIGRVREHLRPGTVGSVDTYSSCSGIVKADGTDERQDDLFQLGSSAFAGFVTVNLTTSSDAWLPYDLKGRAQPIIYRANAPRLAAALQELAEVLHSETEPDDPTYFARPTEDGAENLTNADGSVPDLWRGREIPYRNRVFRSVPPFAEGYRRSADGEVLYVPVHDKRGRVLGYLWASDAHGAASFEPRDDADEDGFKAGLVWLDRLQSAYEHGMSPSAALREVAHLPDESGAGRAQTVAHPLIEDLAVLRERASED